MQKLTRHLTPTVFAFFVLGVMISCSSTETSQRGDTGGTQKTADNLEMPKLYAVEKAERYGQLTRNGYDLLDEGKLEEAVAAFSKQVELIPEGKWGYYNLACAYSRNGHVDTAIYYLTKAVENGWDNPHHLQSDPDLPAVREDPRFQPLLTQVEQTAKSKESMFAAGLPAYDEAPRTFADEEAYQQWLQAEKARLDANGNVWHNWQKMAARMDFEARKLAVLRELKADDPEFDHDLERIKSMTQLKSIWSDSWGSLCRAITREVDAYLAAHGNTESANEAAYRGGMAAMMHCGVENTDDPMWARSIDKAEEYFAHIDETSEFYGRAQAFMLAAELAQAGDAERLELKSQIEQFARVHGDNDGATQVASVFFGEEMIRALWPIPLQATDIDGNPVSLQDYRDKVVLVDFWATWCGPCRAELPHLKEAYKKYHGDGFEILSISLDYPDRMSQADYRAWITERGMNWTHVYDEKNWKSPLVDAYLVQGIPSPFLIGRDGQLAALHKDCRGEQLEESIKKALYAEAG